MFFRSISVMEFRYLCQLHIINKLLGLATRSVQHFNSVSFGMCMCVRLCIILSVNEQIRYFLYFNIFHIFFLLCGLCINNTGTRLYSAVYMVCKRTKNQADASIFKKVINVVSALPFVNLVLFSSNFIINPLAHHMPGDCSLLALAMLIVNY